MKEIQTLRPFTKFCVTIGNLPTSYTDSLTYEEQLLWLCNYIKNTVIPAINDNAEAVKELQNLYIQLKEYVDHYFDNLDVQEEINNKLDEMAESGELTDIIAQYLQLAGVLAFISVSDMKEALNLVNGSTVKTLGFNNYNLGGGAYYKIRNITNQDIVDEITIISLHDENLIAELIPEKIMSAKQFGADEDSENDQAIYIQKGIDYCVANNVKEFILDGSYFINTTLLIQNKENLEIKNGEFRVNETDEILSNFNILHIKNCNNIIIDNVNAYELDPESRTRTLRKGGYFIEDSNNCLINNCYLENTHSGIMLYNSKKCTISNNTILVNYQSNQFATSGILNYGSSDNNIINNKIYGEYYDGVLSIFGNSKNVIVDGNILHGKNDDIEPLMLPQGITIDSGVQDCICTNNIIYDMWYGIDNKSDVKNSLIKGNTIVGCKIGIADRDGENVGAGATFNTSILNNKIIIQKDFKTDDSTRTDGSDYLQLNKYYYVGINCGNRFAVNIKNNDIIIYGTLTDCVLGIYASNSSSPNQYVNNLNISNNNIELSSGFGATTSNAPTNSTCITIKDIQKGIITNNTFKTDTIGNTYHMIELYGNNTDLLISNNNAYCTNFTNHLFISLIDSATIIDSKIINNLLRKCGFINNLGSITNVVQYNKFEFIARRIKQKQLTANTWTTVCKFKLPYDGTIQLRLKSLISASGLKTLDSLYNVNVSGTTVTPITIYDHNSNINVQFINEGTSKEISLQLKMEINHNISDVFITDFITTQEDTQFID